MAKTSFTAILEKEGELYVALCPELDVASQGHTVEEATANLKEAVELFLECADPAEIEGRRPQELLALESEYPPQKGRRSASPRFLGSKPPLHISSEGGGSAPCGRWRVAPGFNPGLRRPPFHS